MGSFPGSSEIIEASEELSSGSSWGHQKFPVLKLGYKDSLEDDINKLFEAINLKSPSNSLSRHDRISPFNKLASKKPITMPRSPGIGNSESLTLKQALRELSLTKASEMAAMKRLSKVIGSSGVSEAGRIKSLYNAVVVEARNSGPSLDIDKGNMVQISLVPEESVSEAVETVPEQLQMPKINSANPSAQSSSRFSGAVAQKDVGTTTMQSGNFSTSGIKSEMMHKEENSPEPSVHSPSCSDQGGDTFQSVEKVPTPTKLVNKTSASKVRKVRLHTVPSTSCTTSGNRIGKFSRNTSRLVKPISRNKNVVKKKMKQESNSIDCTSDKYNEVDTMLDPCTSQLICQRCRCALDSENKVVVQDPSVDDPSSLNAKINSTNIPANPSKEGSSESSDRSKALVKAKSNTKSREKGEFSQSSKDSPGECSSSTTTSDLSNTSRSSCGNRPHMSKDFRWEAIRHVRMQNGILGLKHFNLLKKLGCGDIGTVYLAELISTNCLFAIKVMDNEFLARKKKMPRAQTEREILRILDHPFLPTLYAQFTSDNLSCLVMEYCPGGDLHVLRQRQPGRSFSEPAARFYVAEVLLAMEYLHMLGVIYRDLKPENILVREDGHIMLTDFDLSLRCTVSPTLLKSSSNGRPVKMSGPCTESRCVEPFWIEPPCQVTCFSPRLLQSAAKTRKIKGDLASQIRSLPQLVAEPTDARSNSFVGTHEYLAPEIIKGDGHGAAVDWWTFGIFLYELLYGKTPFKGSNNEETLVNVVLQNFTFPETPLVSFHARDLIKGLLVKEPENRLGSEKGAAEIKQHPFFEGLNWALVRCAVPPEIPELSDFEGPNLFGQKSQFLECKATGEHLEFELF